MGLRGTVALLIALVCSLAGGSQDPATVGLGSPEVTKLSWNTRSMICHDIDGDGRNDLALLNNDRARVEILYQRTPGEVDEPATAAGSSRWEPVLSDARFRSSSVATGIRMFALAAGDLNNDGAADLVFTGSPDGLTIRYQTSRGEFGSKRVVDIHRPVGWLASLVAADLDGDGDDDLALLTERDLLVFTQGRRGELDGPTAYALSTDEAFGLLTVDANLDQRPDLLYQVAQGPDALRLRLGLADGGFGPEQSFRLDTPRGLIAPLALPETSGMAFAHIHATTGLLEVTTLGEKAASQTLLEDVRPRVFSARIDGSDPASYALADLDGDSRPDLVMADAGGAQVRVLLQLGEGIFSAATAYPSLADVRSIAAADLDHDGRDEILLASPKERVVAVSRLTDSGRLSYPAPLPTVDKPYAVAAADLDGDGTLEVTYVHEERSRYGVTVLSRPTAGDEWQATTIELDDLDNPPRNLRLVDADQDGDTDLAVFIPHEPMRLLLQGDGGTFAPAAIETGFRKGLVDDLAAASFTTGDVTGDGLEEMLVATNGFARSLKVSEHGQLEVVDQYNSRDSESRLAAALAVDLDRDGNVEIVLIDQDGDRLEVQVKGSGGVYRFAESVPMEILDLVEARVADLNGNSRPDVLLMGRAQLWWLPIGTSGLDLVPHSTYETDLEDVRHDLVAAGDLNGDGRFEIVALDTRDSQVLEVIAAADGNQWQRVMHFTVFDADPHYEGQRGSATEPREVLIADVTGDGRDDLVLLVHDRVLVYPQG